MRIFQWQMGREEHAGGVWIPDGIMYKMCSDEWDCCVRDLIESREDPVLSVDSLLVVTVVS